MAYIKTDWSDGDVITEAGLDHLENGVYNNSVAIGDLTDLDTTDKTNLVAAINEAAQSGGGGGSLSNAVKDALLQLASKVAYIDDDGQEYYDDLYDALYPAAEIVSINAEYTQSGTVYTTTSLEDLRNDLVVTVIYDNGSVVPVITYTLSGSLTVGTSTITVTYSGFTDTFDVTVSAAPTVSSIAAVYTQSGTVYDTDSLDSLKADLVVTATYSDSSTATVPSADYTLSGTLAVGTSTITVSYESKTTSFSVTVTAGFPYISSGLIHYWDAIDNTPSGHSNSTTTWYDLVGTDDLAMSASQPTWSSDAANFDNSVNQQTFTGAETSEACAGKSFEVVFQSASTNTCSVCQVFKDSSAAGKACLYSDNSIAVKGASDKTYPTGLTSVSDVNYICGTFDSNGAIDSVYVNGSAVSRGSTTHSLSGQKTNVIIGKVDSGYRYYGKIHAVRIYDKILSASEVASNYATDVTRFSLGEGE